MKTLSMLNLKGGVGKTVSAVGLAKALADLGRGRVLLVDADPQGGLTRWVTNRVPDDFKTANLSSLVQGFTTVPGTLIDLDDTELHADDPSRAALWSGMSLIPTATTRIVVDAIFGGTIDYRALRDPLERDTPDDFAYCVVDVGHGDNDSTRIGVVASDLVITVIAGWQVQSVQQLSEV
ncbi:CobQ/CobB/MinD/ParA nucleotide binding domain-containing protein, partial [Actinopolyspora alba]